MLYLGQHVSMCLILEIKHMLKMLFCIGMDLDLNAFLNLSITGWVRFQVFAKSPDPDFLMIPLELITAEMGLP